MFWKRVLQFLAFCTVGLAIVAGLVTILWSSDNRVVYETYYPEGKLGWAVRPDRVAPDQNVIVTLDYCKKLDTHGTVLVRLVGKESILRIPWPDAEEQPKHCSKQEIPVVIPAFARDDEYYIDFEIESHLNPIKTKTTTIRTDTFHVSATGNTTSQ